MDIEGETGQNFVEDEVRPEEVEFFGETKRKDNGDLCMAETSSLITFLARGSEIL